TQTYTGAVTLGSDVTLTASSITTASTIAAGNHNLTLVTDTLALGGNVNGGSGTLTIAPKSAGTIIGLGSGSNASGATLQLSDTELGYINVTSNYFAAIVIGDASAGTGTLKYDTSANQNFHSALTLKSLSGAITTYDQLNVSSSNNLTISTGGAVSLSAINTANVLAVTGNGI
ncbi:hypothetical protein, partial [Polynucleobacter sp. AP-Latsch-80-C2]|uniref:hypothetical protein n=1 Tax=Polynucleobacter sp. AP-Latsch-80-C2 TaxID=2576931 RepID=UPI001C0D9DCD